jgi:hypothetical protein
MVGDGVVGRQIDRLIGRVSVSRWTVGTVGSQPGRLVDWSACRMVGGGLVGRQIDRLIGRLSVRRRTVGRLADWKAGRLVDWWEAK